MKRVIVLPPDPNWPRAFEEAARHISKALGDNLLEIHHIGSTAIGGIYAKPIIDVLPVVRDITAVDFCNQAMQALGYEAMGEFGIPGRRFFRRDNDHGVRTHHVHAFQVGSPHVARHLAFRDFMRAHSDIALQYSDLKRKLAGEHPFDIEAYMDGKDSFIKEMETKALDWSKGLT